MVDYTIVLRPIVLQILLLTLLLLQLLASKLSLACSRVIKLFFLPSQLYLRLSGVSSYPSIHTHSSSPSSPSGMVLSLFYSSSYATGLYFGSIPTFSPQRLGKALWVVQDRHSLFTPSGFLAAYVTPVLSIFTSCFGYALSISVGSNFSILHVLLLHCFNVNMLHVRSCPFFPSKPFTLGSR